MSREELAAAILVAQAARKVIKAVDEQRAAGHPVSPAVVIAVSELRKLVCYEE